MRVWIAGIFTLALASGTASAADVDGQPAPMTSSSLSWNGPYIGASLGYGWLRDVDYAVSPPLHSSGEDIIFGGHVGYLHQFNSFVIGAEGEFNWLDINFEGFPIDVETSVAAKLRAGVTFNHILLTGHAGATYAKTNIGLKDWGWVAGGGIDYLMSENIVVGVSYDHMRFDGFDGTMIDAEIDLVKGRLSYKF